MGSRKSTCLYLDQEVVKTTRRVGLNLSRVSENTLVEAIGLLGGVKPRDGLNSTRGKGGILK